LTIQSIIPVIILYLSRAGHANQIYGDIIYK